jgi:hypothetical protein
MDEHVYELSTEALAARMQAVSASGVVPPVAALNPGAGRHGLPSDPREVQATLRAGHHTWERFPYYARRYGERGQRFTGSGSAGLGTLAAYPQEVVDREVRWLGALPVPRGMPRWLLASHLETLHAELVAAVPALRPTGDCSRRPRYSTPPGANT